MAGIEDVATYLDLKPAELATQLRSGKSLADIAQGPGQDGRGAQDDDHRRGDEAARRGGDGRQADEGAGDEAARGPGLPPRRSRQRRPQAFGFHRGGPGGPRPGFKFGFGFGLGAPGLMGGIEDVATYLDLKPADLVMQLRSGKSLADIAQAQGKTVQGLETTITAAVTKQLDAAVTAGKLSKDQETKVLSGLHRISTTRQRHRLPLRARTRRLEGLDGRTALRRPPRPQTSLLRRPAPAALRTGSVAGSHAVVGRSASRGRAFAAHTDDREVAEARAEPRRLARRPRARRRAARAARRAARRSARRRGTRAPGRPARTGRRRGRGGRAARARAARASRGCGRPRRDRRSAARRCPPRSARR